MANSSTPNAYDAGTSLLEDEEKKRRLFWSLIWLIFALAIVLPLASFIAPFWLLLQLLEAFFPVCTWYRNSAKRKLCPVFLPQYPIVLHGSTLVSFVSFLLVCFFVSSLLLSVSSSFIKCGMPMYFWKSKWSRSRIILLGWSVIVTQGTRRRWWTTRRCRLGKCTYSRLCVCFPYNNTQIIDLATDDGCGHLRKHGYVSQSTVEWFG